MLTKLIITVLFFTLNLITFSKMTEYQDFSSERQLGFSKLTKRGRILSFLISTHPLIPV